MLYFLISILASEISYLLARGFTTFPTSIKFIENSKLPTDVLHLFWHVDILNLIIISILALPLKFSGINIINPREFVKARWHILLFSFPIFASMHKGFLSNTIPSSVISTYSALTSLAVPIFAYLILKERTPRNFWPCLAIGLFGFGICKWSEIKLGNFAWLPASYVVTNAISVIALNYVVKQRNTTQGILFDNIVYCVYGVAMLGIFGGFKTEVLFSWQLFLVAVFCLIHHVCIIIATKEFANSSVLQFSSMLKIATGMAFGVIVFRQKVTTYEIIGAVIICLAVLALKRSQKSPKPA